MTYTRLLRDGASLFELAAEVIEGRLTEEEAAEIVRRRKAEADRP